MDKLSMVGIACAMSLVAACGSKQPSVPAEPAANTAPGPAQPAASAPARDISALRACELVTPAEVATIVGGKLLAEPAAGFPNCSYVIEVGDDTESYHVAYSEPGALQAMVDYEIANGAVERLDGLWDLAVVVPRDAETGGGFSAIAIRKGDLAVEAWGERKEPAIEIARLAVSRVN
jgi:hypothetical protein